MRALTVLLIAASFTAGAMADEPAGSKDRSHQGTRAQFQALDRDQDGRLSKNEARSENTLSAQFNSYDADSDGYVTESEYMAMASSGPSRTTKPNPDREKSPY